MTLLFLDGFDSYGSATRMLDKWDSVSDGVNSVPTSGGRTGGYVQLQNSFSGPFKVLANDAHATFIVGLAVNKQNNGGNQNIAFFGGGGTQHQCGFTLYGDGQVLAYRAENNGAGSSIYLGRAHVYTQAANGWDYYEFLATLSASAGVMIARKNGVELFNLTGQNNKFQASTTLDAVLLQTFGGSPAFDDMYICNGAGSAPHNTFLGECRVRQLLPTGAGSNTGFTPSTGANYTTVDEIPANQTDYNTGTTDGTKDTYAMADLTDPSGSTVYGLQNNLYAAKTDAGAKFIAPVVRSGGTDYVRASQSLSTTYKTYFQVEALNPATSGAWTVASINAVEVGAAAKDS